MSIAPRSRTSLVALFLIGLLPLPACRANAPQAEATATAVVIVATPSTTPDWFNIKMTDAVTGQDFSMHDFLGKVVLVETMAEWCPTCVQQQIEVRKLQGLTGNSKDVVHVSLDTDFHEDAASLKEYASTWGFDWHFAVSPLEVDRALSNLYSAEFMNPPFAPMLIIDRHGSVHVLPFGVKKAEVLQSALAPYLAP